VQLCLVARLCLRGLELVVTHLGTQLGRAADVQQIRRYCAGVQGECDGSRGLALAHYESMRCYQRYQRLTKLQIELDEERPHPRLLTDCHSYPEETAILPSGLRPPFNRSCSSPEAQGRQSREPPAYVSGRPMSSAPTARPTPSPARSKRPPKATAFGRPAPATGAPRTTRTITSIGGVSTARRNPLRTPQKVRLRTRRNWQRGTRTTGWRRLWTG
jgi:hypothetical protein